MEFKGFHNALYVIVQDENILNLLNDLFGASIFQQLSILIILMKASCFAVIIWHIAFLLERFKI